MKSLPVLIFCVYTAFLNYSFANERGNGGDGLLIRGRPYLLDLVEAGVQLGPFFNPLVQPVPAIQRLLEPALSAPEFASALPSLTQKLSEIHGVSQSLAYALTILFQLYDFRLVDPELVNIPDEDVSFDYDPKLLVQLAIRRGAVIMINKAMWARLDEYNQGALLLHEISYAFSEKSPPARDLNGYFYTDGFVNHYIQSRLYSLLRPTALRGLKRQFDLNISYIMRLDGSIAFMSGQFTGGVAPDRLDISLFSFTSNDDELAGSCRKMAEVSTSQYGFGLYTSSKGGFAVSQCGYSNSSLDYCIDSVQFPEEGVPHEFFVRTSDNTDWLASCVSQFKEKISGLLRYVEAL